MNVPHPSPSHSESSLGVLNPRCDWHSALSLDICRKHFSSWQLTLTIAYPLLHKAFRNNRNLSNFELYVVQPQKLRLRGEVTWLKSYTKLHTSSDLRSHLILASILMTALLHWQIRQPGVSILPLVLTRCVCSWKGHLHLSESPFLAL